MVRAPHSPESEGPRERNRRLLQRHGRRGDKASRLGWRNALVTANLPLARSIAARHLGAWRDHYDDLVQVASLGLIRAVEAFDPERQVSLSSFAVPYMRGALLHEQRDRQAPVRIPRALWELRQQAGRLQEQQRQQGQPPLKRQHLARLLDCGVEQLLEVETLALVAQPRSLDAPASATGQEEGGPSLLEWLADPRSLEPAIDEAGDGDGGEGGRGAGGMACDEEGPEDARRSWLEAQMAGLDSQRRDLVQDRLLLNCTWVELGRRHNIHPRMAQRRCEATLEELRRAAAAWQPPPAALSPAEAPPARAPAGQRAGSADH